MLLPVAVLSQYFFGITIFILSIFLILLILVQRGRGGGLTGALGGPGGQSAFGTKAGDLFTRITIVTAGIWIFLCALAVWSLQSPALPTLSGSKAASGSAASGTMESTGTGTSTGMPSGASLLPEINLPSSSLPSSSSALPPVNSSPAPTDPTAESKNSGSVPADSTPDNK